MLLKRGVEIRSAKTRLNWLNKWAMAMLEVANGKISVIYKLHSTWSSGYAFVSGAGGLRFKSRASQIENRVANGSAPLRHVFKRDYVARVQ